MQRHDNYKNASDTPENCKDSDKSYVMTNKKTYYTKYCMTVLYRSSSI